MMGQALARRIIGVDARAHVIAECSAEQFPNYDELFCIYHVSAGAVRGCASC